MGLFRVRGRLNGPATPCFIAPEGPALRGAVALEILFLAVDPVAKGLIPVEGFVGSRLALGATHFGRILARQPASSPLSL
jgi:hypothetical protein